MPAQSDMAILWLILLYEHFRKWLSTRGLQTCSDSRSKPNRIQQTMLPCMVSMRATDADALRAKRAPLCPSHSESQSL